MFKTIKLHYHADRPQGLFAAAIALLAFPQTTLEVSHTGFSADDASDNVLPVGEPYFEQRKRTGKLSAVAYTEAGWTWKTYADLVIANCVPDLKDRGRAQLAEKIDRFFFAAIDAQLSDKQAQYSYSFLDSVLALLVGAEDGLTQRIELIVSHIAHVLRREMTYRDKRGNAEKIKAALCEMPAEPHPAAHILVLTDDIVYRNVLSSLDKSHRVWYIVRRLRHGSWRVSPFQAERTGFPREFPADWLAQTLPSSVGVVQGTSVTFREYGDAMGFAAKAIEQFAPKALVETVI